MPLHHLYYHLVWATKDRQPLITDEIEADVHRFVEWKVGELKGRVLAIGGVEDHIHLVTTIPATMAVAQFAGKVKGASSRRAGQIVPFGWQAQYGSYTVSRSQLDKVVAYVRNQKHHHARGTTVEVLETCD